MSLYFNPRPREEGDLIVLSIVLDVFKISIHALVKRATGDRSYSCAKLVISIHALVKRATYHFSVIKCELVHFNPRPREEGDYPKDIKSYNFVIFQSTPS